MRAYMEWWLDFLQVFNGLTPMVEARPSTPLYIDASLHAAGAVYGNRFLHTPWCSTPAWQDLHINKKKVLLICFSVTTALSSKMIQLNGTTILKDFSQYISKYTALKI